MYRVSYIPVAKKDILDAVLYIADTLNAPKAASDLMNALDKSISMLEEFPYTCRVYQPGRPLEYEYRMLPVKNYAVFYVVYEDAKLVEIHRVVYAKRDLTQIIK